MSQPWPISRHGVADTKWEDCNFGRSAVFLTLLVNCYSKSRVQTINTAFEHLFWRVILGGISFRIATLRGGVQFRHSMWLYRVSLVGFTSCKVEWHPEWNNSSYTLLWVMVVRKDLCICEWQLPCEDLVDLEVKYWSRLVKISSIWRRVKCCHIS